MHLDKRATYELYEGMHKGFQLARMTSLPATLASLLASFREIPASRGGMASQGEMGGGI